MSVCTNPNGHIRYERGGACWDCGDAPYGPPPARCPHTFGTNLRCDACGEFVGVPPVADSSAEPSSSSGSSAQEEKR